MKPDGAVIGVIEPSPTSKTPQPQAQASATAGTTRTVAATRAAQRAALGEGRLLGIGICAVLEANTYGSAFYRASGIAGSGHEAAVVRVEPTGAVLASCGLMGSGQGYETTLAQAAAAGLGADVGDVTMQLGDTDVAPYGMGSRGARGATAGGSALWLAGRRLREKVLAIAAGMLGLNSAVREHDMVQRATSTVRPSGRASASTAASSACGCSGESSAMCLPSRLSMAHARLG